MSAAVIRLPTTPVERLDADGIDGREFQELRVALAAVAGQTPPHSRPWLVVDNEREKFMWTMTARRTVSEPR